MQFANLVIMFTTNHQIGKHKMPFPELSLGSKLEEAKSYQKLDGISKLDSSLNCSSDFFPPRGVFNLSFQFLHLSL